MSKFTLAMLLALAVGEALAAAARVDFVYGVVTVAALDGREQPLLRGAELNSGDTVRTAEGRAQLRFSDGAYVSSAGLALPRSTIFCATARSFTLPSCEVRTRKAKAWSSSIRYRSITIPMA